MWKLLPFFFFLAVVYAGGNPIAVTTEGNLGVLKAYLTSGVPSQFGINSSPLRSIVVERYASPMSTIYNWFSLFLSEVGVSTGGLNAPAIFSYPGGDHVVFTASNPDFYRGVTLDTTLRVDAQGWATILWEFTSDGPLPTLYPNNYGENYLTGEGLVYSTSSGDSTFDTNDDWAVTYDPFGNFATGVTGFSFGRGRYLSYQGKGLKDGQFGWSSELNLQPFETQSLLQVLAVAWHAPVLTLLHDKQNMQYRLHSVLTHERNFYNYATVEGYRLLDHLTPAQLSSIVNWNFVNAGIATKLETDSESRVVRLDGSMEQLSLQPGVYCLFEDQALQLNVQLTGAGVIDEVVVVVREHGMSFHAFLNGNDQPEFVVDGHSVEIPMSRFDGNLVTESAPFQVPFTHMPLSAFSEYHVNSLHFRDIFTVVGGNHPDFGGFFNVAVHKRISENRFPGLLNVLSGSEHVRDGGFSSSVVPDIWFTL